MSFFSEKWRESAITTKAATAGIALAAIMILICAILFFVLGGMMKSAGIANATESAGMYGIMWLVLFLITALLAFGLLHVNRAARIGVIYIGLIVLFPFVLTVILWILALIKVPLLKDLFSVYWALLKGVVPLIMSLVPGNAKALGAFLLIVFVGPLVLYVLSMLLLFIFGKDFKNGGAKSKLVAYLLWLFLGAVSAHKFYLEKDRVGILFFFTCQMFGVAWFINFFTLGKQVAAYNAKLAQEDD